MLAPPRSPTTRTPPPLAVRRPPRKPRPSRLRRARRVAVIAASACLLPALVSYVHALTQASNAGIGIRTVEWLRDNGARGLVNSVESIYYSLNAPAKGGPALRSLPHQAGLLPSLRGASRHV